MKTLEYRDGILKLIDQTKLPHELIYVDCTTHHEVAKAIKDMIVRGAPAIGVTAAYGVAIGASLLKEQSKELFFNELAEICNEIKAARPTAVNLSWAADRMYRLALENGDKTIEEINRVLIHEAGKMDREDVEINNRIGLNGSALIPDSACILTHCNAGALATCGYGTALGVIRAAHEQGKNIKVFADETRPYLQGARLTAWELMQDNIPVTLICDNMSGHFMRAGKIDCVIVGADRVALNGDTANKIGTYMAAVLAKENKIPFYVAAPVSTIDYSMESGEGIPIEERKAEEVTMIAGARIAPEGITVANPSFDVTPNRYITAIITERGVVTPPFDVNLKKLR